MMRNNNKSTRGNISSDISLERFKNRVRNADLNKYFVAGSILLILGIGLYAIFSPTQQNARLSNPACGKIVVAADGSNLRANVSPTLIGAKYFLVINPLSQKLLESAKNPYFGQPTGRIQSAYFIAGKGEEAVIAGSINPGCYKVLSQFGVRGFAGYHGNVRNAVELYRQARISQGMVSTQSTQVAMGNNVNKAPMAPQRRPRNVNTNISSMAPRYVICPNCSWQVNCQGMNGQLPRCPNCSTIINNTGSGMGQATMGICPPGRMPMGQVAMGACPPGQYPMGQIPTGQMTLGQGSGVLAGPGVTGGPSQRNGITSGPQDRTQRNNANVQQVAFTGGCVVR
jgi:predicted Fe-Mo cluster-binding NifX family protein